MKFIRQMKKLSLARKEKEDVRGALISFINKNPALVRNIKEPRHIYQKVPNFLSFLTNNYMLATIIAAILVAMSGGVSYAAESSLPGDLLYPIKVHVNEEVRAVVATTPGAKANVDAEIAARRLQEAEKLSAEGKLTSSTQAMLAQDFTQHATKANEEIKLAQVTSGDLQNVAKLNSDFEAVLNAHSNILNKLNDKARLNGDKGDGLDSLIAQLSNAASTTVSARVESEDKLNNASSTPQVESAASGKRGSVENKLAELIKFFNNKKDQLSVSEQADIQARINNVSSTIFVGDKALAEGKYGEAFSDYQNAERLVQEAKLLINAGDSLSVDLGNNSSSTTTSTTSTTHFSINGAGGDNENERGDSNQAGKAQGNGDDQGSGDNRESGNRIQANATSSLPGLNIGISGRLRVNHDGGENDN